MVNIITIEREYGCGGGDIARLVADRLGWKLWDQPGERIREAPHRSR
jgi:Cytidylate kinase-like family